MPLLPRQKEIILENKSKVIHLDLRSTGLEDDDIYELRELLGKNRYITSVDLTRNNLTSKAAVILSECTQLKIINVSQNNIGSKGAKYLINMPNIESLDLCNNAVTDGGAKAILEKCNLSRQVKLYGNPRIAHQLIKDIECQCSKNQINKNQKENEEKSPNATRLLN